MLRNLVSGRMARTVFLAFSKTFAVLLVAISLLTAGLAHNAVMTAADLEKAEYLSSMGLGFEALCSAPDADGGRADMGDCPVCHLAASLLLPDPVQSFRDIELRTAVSVLVPAQIRVLGRSHNPATPVRAPPLA